jgi:hypothetical protein
MRVTLPFFAVAAIITTAAAMEVVKPVAHVPLAVFKEQTLKDKVFQLDDGGCLIGPLTIWNGQGVERFKLAKGVEFPSGCRNGSSK